MSINFKGLTVPLSMTTYTTGSFATSMLPLSYIIPLGTAIPIVVIPVCSLCLFKEKVSRMNWLGIAIICVGVMVFGVFQTGVNP